ncbi:ATP-binding protein [Pseudomonas putida]|uniref:ATP-binding protein n=1 Tax=Pseudomonas putida TaxID=303 RepID=A0AAW4BTB1_PSEPU|nr:ATP-binding protein [Pseudomonas putida]MBF8701005.1 ATP-binding protein [Pseudomonas putida]MBF8736071.1 ATP-binding protein [Pseudomonas putida]MDZ5110272.1 ATP-binding protein [Pseudomonas putida]
MIDIFPRRELAADMARQLLKPSALDIGLRSGLFFSGLRRTGKTTFLKNDLIPALEEMGALVIYVDLWSDTQTSPVVLVLAAVRKALADLQKPTSAFLQKLKALRGAEVEVAGLKFGFNLETLGTEGGVTLAEALTEVVDQARTDVVLVVDEVQQAITTEDGQQMMLALKAVRDAINPRPNTPGHFLFIGTGSHRAMVNELTARRNQAFAGATNVPYPVLDRDYVEFWLKRLAKDGLGNLPSLDVAAQAFKTLGSRPEEFIRALRQLVHSPASGMGPDEVLPVIASTLRSAAADLELMKVEELGVLAEAIFARIASVEGDARGVFSNEAAAEYSKSVGREVRVEEIQPVANELLAANLIMRRGHGLYGVTDPFVQEIWRERQELLGRL